jgi:hypothetical protein
MKGVSGGSKRGRDPDIANDLPSAKRQRVDDHALKGAAFASPEVRHTMEQILASLQKDGNSLNLSGFSPATLDGLAPVIPEAALASVTHLILPSNLQALPALCERMRELQRLVIEGFLGSKLDLLKWPGLLQVSGSVSVNTEEIHVHGNVDLALSSDRTTKLRCFRHFDDGQVRRHALPGHSYYKILPGNVMPDLSSLNWVTNFPGTTAPIECRHIARYVLPHLEAKDIPLTPDNGYLGLSSADNLRQKITIDFDARFYNDLKWSCAYHGVSDSQFGLWATQQMEALKEAAKARPLSENQTISKAFYATTSNHAMGLVFRYKPDKDEQFVEILMDTNLTLTHKRNTDNDLANIGAGARQWRFSSLLDPQLMMLYFFDPSSAAVLFVDPSPRADGERPEINLQFADEGIENFSFLFALCGLTDGFKDLRAELQIRYLNETADVASSYKTLQAPRWMGDSYGLAAAVCYGYTDTVRVQMACFRDFLAWYKTIDRSNPANQLPDKFQLRLICPSGTLAQLYAQTAPEHRPAFRVLCDGLLELFKDELISSETCCSLLGEAYHGRSLVEIVLLGQDQETLRITGKLLIALVERRALTLSQSCQMLDSTVSKSGAAVNPLAWIVLSDCTPELFDTYAELLHDLYVTELNQAKDWIYDWLDTPTEPGPPIEKRLADELLLPLLVGRNRDANTTLSNLQTRGTELLATRLLALMKTATG